MVLKLVVIFVIFFVLLAIKVRIPFALGIICFIIINILPIRANVINISQRSVSILARSWPLLAIPLFVLAGNIFKTGGMTDDIIKVVNVFFGRIHGGLAIVNVVASFFFGGISGSAAADTASIGGILIPLMVKEGYDADFSTVVTITSSTLGPIVPPSILMIIFAWTTETSIASLFAGGYIPGFCLMLAQSFVSYLISVKRNYPIYKPKPFKESLRIIYKGIPCIIFPFIVLIGILGGIFTATETGAIAVAYALIVSIFLYKKLKWNDIPTILLDTAKVTGMVGLLIAFATSLSWLLTVTRIPYLIAAYLAGINMPAIIFLLISSGIALLLGCFMNPGAILLMIVPLLYPAAMMMGIHTIHFAIVIIVALAFGHITPPVGVCLFIGSAISGLPIEKLIKPLIPFMIINLVTLAILIIFPELILFIPKLLGLA